MLPIPDLNFGSIDAVSYRQRDQREFLKKTLYREHFLHKIMEPSKYFLIGEKGTGKTSYSVFLENTDYENMRAKVVELNSTDYQKFISLKESGNLSVSSYSDIWRVILLMIMCDTVATKTNPNAFNFYKFNAIKSAIDKYYNNAFRPEVDTSLEFIRESDVALEIIKDHLKVGDKETRTEKTVNFQLNLLELERNFENALNSLRLENDITLFIDGIDIRPADISFDQYIQCIQGLANAAWQINTDFFANIKDSRGRMKVCLLMRPDILDQMGFQNLNGKVRDNGVVLNWQTTYEEFRTSPIFKMISGIIARQQLEQIEPHESWKHYFPYALQNQRISEKQDDPFIGLLRYSFYRPRDIVQYLILMQEYVIQNQNDKNQFSEKSFHKCERDFSDYLLGEVKDYLSFYYNSYDFDQIVGFFSTLRGRNNFSWEHFSDSFNEYKSKLSEDITGVDELRGTPEKFLQFLYSLNFIGYIEQDEFGGNFVHWCFRDRTPVKLRPQVKYDRTYTVHPGLARSLLVGRAGVSARPPRMANRNRKLKSDAPPSGLRVGKVISAQMQRGFTFLQPSDGGENVFVSLNLLRKERIGRIEKGDELIFEAAIGPKGKLRAISLKRP